MFDELAKLFGQNKLMYILSYLIACKTDLKTSSNPYLILEALMIKLCKLDEMEDIAKIIEKLNYGSITQTQPISNISSAQSQPVQSKDSTKESAVKIPDAISKEETTVVKLQFTQDNLEQLWQRILTRAKKISQMCAIALESTTSKKAEAKKLCLTVEGKTFYNCMKTNLNPGILILFSKKPVNILHLQKQSHQQKKYPTYYPGRYKTGKSRNR